MTSDGRGRSHGRERPGTGAVVRRLGLVALLVLIDLWSKARVFAWLDHPATVLLRSCPHRHGRLHVLGDDVGWFTFMLSENSGAATGLLSGHPGVLVVGRVLAASFLVWLILRTPVARRWFSLALVLVLAGALGNLYDNLARASWGHSGAEGFRWGMVRDFIDVYFAGWKWHFPTFNVADSCITVGAVLLLLSGLGREEEGTGAETGTGTGAGAALPPGGQSM